MNLKKLMLITLFGVLIILSAWGGFILGKDTNGKEISKVDFSKDSMSINIRITNTQSMPSGTAYTLVLKNTSKYLIKQNSVYLSYPIKQGNSGVMTNKCKVEATGNKIDIKPNEEVILNVFVPSENYDNNNKIDNNRPQYEIEGYLNVVSNLTHFGQSGELAK
ncbi:hypothetical protein [Candidatus Clostridium radicumherbarum]|uniref:DUF4352 domain-containing protein n=1 Tax=Candidatus Clostridium radicumherbarum TaxID=3381662 RepID=A0ABW8TY29_9CLOT